ANSDKKLPVMIWIHGGAFVFGYAKKFPADGIITNLVNRGVVVVTIQYRLGALGFFTTRTHDFEANLGLFDQLMAFRWVQREISNFGGDAGNVTIFGESAGACSVAFHTYSNISVTQNLYHRAIIESGAAKTCLSGYLYRDQQQSHDFALKLCAKYNFTTAQWNSGNFNNLNTCLNTESYASIVEAQKAGVWLVVAHPNSTFLPGMPKQLAEAMGKNRPPLPVIIGTNRDEMVADVGNNTSQGQTPLKDFTSDAVIAQAKIIAANYPNNNDKIADILGRVYKSPYINSTDNIGWLKAITQMNTARNFFGPTLEDAKIWLGTNGNPNVRMYSLEYGASALSDYYAATPGYTPVAHTFDLAYIFILPDFWIPFLKNISASDRSMIDQFGQMWTNFAKYGDPTPSSSNLPRWDPISLQHQDSYYIINNPSMMASPYFWKDTLLYNDVIPTLAQI
uniref:Carboxylic ester hydrolase n=1 Tax=Plectus sambesii TaxID=2011161 RepID=A0A914XJZ6_9BILA